MSHVLDFYKINDEASELDYFLRIFNTPINERYGKSVFNLDSADGISDDPVIRPEKDESEEGTIDGKIDGYSYIEDNYTDRVFDRLTVIGRDVDKTGKNPYYVCKCKCGNIKSIAVNSLLSGVTKSCGCLKKETDKPNDLTDRVFGKLKVRCLDEEKTAQTHRGYWICDCECGGSKSIRADALLSGRTTSCGCLADANRRALKPSLMNDLTDREFGSLKVIERDWDHDSRQGVYWICECKCGNRKSIRGADLLNGKTKTCGCGQSNNTYDLSGEYGIGYTANGTRFLFDLEDYPKIRQYMWSNDAYGYIIARYYDENGERKAIKMHRLVMGINDPEVHIDHINHDPADNRKSELRIASRNENMHNRLLSKSNTTGRTGVYYDKEHGRWRAAIRVNGTLKYLGLFDSFDEACKARELAENYYYNEFKCENNPSPEVAIALANNRLSIANKSGHTGVCFDSSRNNWRAFLTVNGKQLSIGAYPTYEEACKAREEAERKYKLR